MKPKLTVAMIVKDESRCLARCLKSIKGIAEEIVIADTGSTDNTVSIAEEFGARILNFAWVDDFAAAKNFALDQSSGEWILVLDADEWVSENLAKEVLAFVCGQPAVGRMRQVNDFRRNNQLYRSQCFVSRVFPRGAHYEGRIHEQLVSALPRLHLRGELWHDGYLDNSRRSVRNMRLLASELERDPGNVYFLFQMAVEHNAVGRTEMAFDCLHQAFVRLKPGDWLAPNITVDFVYAIIELKRFDPGVEVVVRAEKFLGDFPDFFLVRGLFYMHLIRSNPGKYISEVPKIEQSFKRCLELGEDERRRSVFGSGSFLANYNLGLFYQAFGNFAGGLRCFEAAAAQGYAPAVALLKKLKSGVADQTPAESPADRAAA